MHRVGPQILFPQPLHLLAQRLVHPRHAQRRAQKLTRIRPVHVRGAENQQIEPRDLRQVLFSLQLPLCELGPGLQLVGFLAGRRVGLVDHAGGALDEDLDAAARSLGAHGHGQPVRAQLVDVVFLREAGFPPAVEDKVERLSVGAVEDAGERLCCVLAGSGAPTATCELHVLFAWGTHALARHPPARSARGCTHP